MPDDGAYEEPVVCHFCPFFHFGGAQVQVHLVVGAGHCGQIEAAHPTELQLVGQGGLQVTVNAIFCKLQGQPGRGDRRTHRHTPNGTLGCVPAGSVPCLADRLCLRLAHQGGQPSARHL